MPQESDVEDADALIRPAPPLTRRRAVFRLTATLALPVLVGANLAARWQDVAPGFYEAVAQIIATLFIAMTVEVFSSRSAWTDPLGPVQAAALVLLSWLGLFACVRAMAGGGTPVTLALAGAGLAASSALVAVALQARLVDAGHMRESRARALLVAMLVLPGLVIAFA